MAETHGTSSINEELPVHPARSLADSHNFVLPQDFPPGVLPFLPARGISNPHLQTLLGATFPGRIALRSTTERKLRLDDDDFIVLHDDRPAEWQRGDHVALLLHGLGGSHRSGYMVRVASKLTGRNVRVFRMDHRGCGAGINLATRPYHAGRIEDLDAAVRMIERLCPGSPISIAGFSLSGNLLLRYLGGNPESLPLSLFRAVAVCPPIDLHRCAENLGATRSGLRYDYYFTRRLISQIARGAQWNDELPIARIVKTPSRLCDFDELYTAPASGFRSADEYYTFASSRSVISAIRVHTTILAAEDDPVVDSRCFADLAMPPNVTLCVTRNGGHLGFIGRSGQDPDRRWMDWRTIDWLLH